MRKALAAGFEQEHRQVSADCFVTATMRRIRAERRRREFVHVGLRIAALLVIVVASPWLISGVSGLNAALDKSLSSAFGQYGAWLVGALAIVAVFATRLRRR